MFGIVDAGWIGDSFFLTNKKVLNYLVIKRDIHLEGELLIRGNVKRNGTGMGNSNFISISFHKCRLTF